MNTDNNVFLEAIRWLGQGVAAIPLHYGAKHPLVAWKQFKDTLPSPIQLTNWFAGQERNIAVLCGGAQNLTVIDFDDLNWFFTWQSWYPDVKTRLVYTPGHPGMRAYFYCIEPAQSLDFRKNFRMEVEIKAQGCITVEPPSLHPCGDFYKLFDDSPIALVNQLEDVFWPFLLEPYKKRSTQPDTQYKVQSVQAWQAAASPYDAINTPQDLISKIKRSIPISSLIPGPYKQQGPREFGCHCPVTRNHKHGDAKSSAFFREDTQSFFCQTCTKPLLWDVINLYSAIHNISEAQARKELRTQL